MKRELICIVCPKGCNMTAEIENGKVLSVSGNTCKRGEEYAINECTNPVRCVTTTMKTENGETVSVKTDTPVAKEKMFELMKIINSKKVVLPISVGDVIIENVFGCNIVATQNKG